MLPTAFEACTLENPSLYFYSSESLSNSCCYIGINPVLLTSVGGGTTRFSSFHVTTVTTKDRFRGQSGQNSCPISGLMSMRSCKELNTFISFSY